MKNKIYLFIGKVEEIYEYIKIPNFAQIEIEKTTNKKIINQKKSVYKLLKYAAKQIYNIDEDFSEFYKNENGKPFTKKYCFSFSHTDDVVAVVVSNENVGVDIEKIDRKINIEKIKEKIVANGEKALNQVEIITLWTQKEAIFKLGNYGKIFSPNKIDTNNEKVISYKINVDASEFIVSIAGLGEVEIKKVY